MPIFDSPHWDLKYRSCVKHGVPELPCRSCLGNGPGEQDPDLEVSATEMDLDVAVFESIPLTDLLPEGMHYTR